MKRNKLLVALLFSTVCGMGLFSCVSSNVSSNTDTSTSSEANTSVDTETSSSLSSYEETFTVIWQNYDGEILETDVDVPYGTMPTYDGETPTREGTEDITYIFSGWNPSLKEVTENATYTARFIEKHNDETILGADPIISDNKKEVQYGLYPQTHVNDASLIESLNSLTNANSKGWYLYNDEYYTKEVANVYNNETYTFDDGTTIVNGTEYWFKCEVISWNVLSDTNDDYFLLSSKLLDAHNFYSKYDNRIIDGATIYANNYEKSDIRNWLNLFFFDMAFSLNDSYIQEIAVKNDSSTTDINMNQYICKDTIDKVYLPSYQDYINQDYGFDANDTSRECKTTDYARARGAWINTKDTSKPNLKYNGSYWTRSPSSEYNYCAWNVNSGGYLSAYAVDGNSHSVRPCITINIV